MPSFFFLFSLLLARIIILLRFPRAPRQDRIWRIQYFTQDFFTCIRIKIPLGPFTNDVSGEGEGGGPPNSDAVWEVA